MAQGNRTNHKKIQFCKRGHDTFICGRAKNRACKDCIREDAAKKYIPHPKQPKQFCPRNHDTFVVGRNSYGGCNECNREKSHENYDPEYKKEYKKLNREKIERQDKEYREKNKDKIRDSELRRRFGIGLKDYVELFIKQEGKCAICRIHQSDFKISLCVDHNHKTAKVRGLLCSDCNFLLGNAKENVKILQYAIDYLKLYEVLK